MTPTEQLLTAALGITWGGLGVSFAIGKWANKRETDADVPLYRLSVLESSVKQAGDKMSDLTGKIQLLMGLVQLFPAEFELKMQSGFVTRREWDGHERRKQE